MSPATSQQPKSQGSRGDTAASLETLVALLNDEFARGILTRIRSADMTAMELAEACGMSESTVYRRLERLDAAGLIRTDTRFDGDGYHRKTFRATVDHVDIALGDDGFRAEVSVSHADSTTPASAASPATSSSDAVQSFSP